MRFTKKSKNKKRPTNLPSQRAFPPKKFPSVNIIMQNGTSFKMIFERRTFIMHNLTVIENELVPVYKTSTGEKVVYGFRITYSIGSEEQICRLD